MQSPFDIFRKHQKMLTVVLTGLAMFAFVILGAVPDPANMPPALTAIFLAGVLGGLAWIAGIRKKKSNEWGLVGVIAGLVLGIAASIAVGPGDVVRADSGNINNQQLQMLINQRGLANQFVTFAYQKARENGAQMFSNPPLFGFGHPDDTKDVVVGELLRREADRIGMQVTDETVNDFIRSFTHDKFGTSGMREFRAQRGVSETVLYEALKKELKANMMARFLYGTNVLPPLEYWDFYRKMNVQESVGIVPIRVADFIDKTAEPSEADLQKLFAEHRDNFPNFTSQGELVEGLPGFHQFRKVALEYVEIPFEAVEKSIPEITDAEIEAYYEENYKSGPALNLPADDAPGSPDAPLLPEMETDKAPTGGGTPAPAEGAVNEKSAEEKPVENKPADNPASAETTPESSPPESKPESPAPADKPEAPAEPADDPAAPDTKEPAPAADTKDDSGASLAVKSSVQLVALFDDEAPAEDAKPAEEAPDAETPAEPAPADASPATETPAAPPAADDKPAPADAPPAEETPAQDKPTQDKPTQEKPAEEKPTEEKPAKPASEATPATPAAETPAVPGEGDKPKSDEAPATEETPAAPAEPAKPRVLDDELRAEIRDQILRRKTAERQQELMAKTFEYMSQDLAVGVTAFEDDPSRVTPEATTEKLKAYARENGLVYERTPLLTQRQLSQSEEYPIGKAASATNFQSPSSVAQMAFNAPPTDLYRPEEAVDIESGSQFVFWKVQDVPAFVPDSLETPGIREQVVETWRELQARGKAKARADELARQANGIDKPLSEIFADTTVTGAKDGPSVSVIHPPRFSWLSAANAQMSPNPFNRPAPMLTELRTVPGDVGEQFMQTVFNELKPGEVGVAHSYDLEYYYVVRVDERTFGPSKDLQAFRERFTTQPVFDQFGFSDYSKLAARELGRYQTNWADELFARHKVDFTGLDRQRARKDDEDA